MLFSSKSIKNGKREEKFQSKIGPVPTSRKELFTNKDLNEMLKNLEPNQSIKYVTKGAWSMHELLEKLLLKTGPADVWITTWTITENPLRTILRLARSGKIKTITALLDHRIGKRVPKALQFAEGIMSQLKLVNIHAKTLVIINEEWAVSVVSTANFSKNNRIECGVISTAREDAEFDKTWIQNIIDNE